MIYVSYIDGIGGHAARHTGVFPLFVIPVVYLAGIHCFSLWSLKQPEMPLFLIKVEDF